MPDWPFATSHTSDCISWTTCLPFSARWIAHLLINTSIWCAAHFIFNVRAFEGVYTCYLPQPTYLHTTWWRRRIKMPFTLTEAHVRSFLDPASTGDWVPFVTAIDPNVRWTIANTREDMNCCTGVFVRSSFLSCYLLTETYRIFKNGLTKSRLPCGPSSRAVCKWRSEPSILSATKPSSKRLPWILCRRMGSRTIRGKFEVFYPEWPWILISVRYCWIMIFDDETGKAVVINEYMNTALVKEVMETNPWWYRVVSLLHETWVPVMSYIMGQLMKTKWYNRHWSRKSEAIMMINVYTIIISWGKTSLGCCTSTCQVIMRYR